MHTSVTLALATLLPSDLAPNTDGLHLNVPSWAFQPDEWSWAFQRGLRSLDLDGQRVWEVGCGTGLNLILLSTWFPNAHLLASDFDPRCTELCSQNLGSTVGLNTARHELLFGRWDLVTSTATSCADIEPVDFVIACIPQVSQPHLDATHGDDLAHYYDPDHYPEARRNLFGLGLNEALLQRAHHVLKPGGHIVLNLGGRPGLSRLLEMFEEYGYNPTVVHEEIIPQHAETSLATMATMELVIGAPFEFFADATGLEQINAAEAEARRRDGVTVYHKIYVIVGTLIR